MKGHLNNRLKLSHRDQLAKKSVTRPTVRNVGRKRVKERAPFALSRRTLETTLKPRAQFVKLGDTSLRGKPVALECPKPLNYVTASTASVDEVWRLDAFQDALTILSDRLDSDYDSYEPGCRKRVTLEKEQGKADTRFAALARAVRNELGNDELAYDRGDISNGSDGRGSEGTTDEDSDSSTDDSRRCSHPIAEEKVQKDEGYISSSGRENRRPTVEKASKQLKSKQGKRSSRFWSREKHSWIYCFEATKKAKPAPTPRTKKSLLLVLPSLVQDILSHARSTKRSNSTFLSVADGEGGDNVSAQREGSSPTIKSICKSYDSEGYGAMSYDEVRNRFYRSAIAATQSQLTGDPEWLEVGCGARALLTRMVLDASPDNTILAFEVNSKSAASAARVLSEQRYCKDRWQIINGFSTESRALPKVDALVHEVFGFLASSEGAGQVIPNARKRFLSRTGIVVPGRAASFFCPLSLSASSVCVEKHSDLYVSKKLVLVKRLNFEQSQIATGFRALEYFDFNSNASDKKQRRQGSFVVTKDGLMNSLGLFLWVGHPKVPLRNRPFQPKTHNNNNTRQAGPAAMTGDTPKGEARVQGTDMRQRRTSPRRRLPDTAFPYGDPTFPAAGALSSISSLSSDSCVAVNWLNPVVVLPHPCAVRKGDVVHVSTCVTLASDHPDYSFSIHVSREHEKVDVGTITLRYSDLYCDYQTFF